MNLKLFATLERASLDQTLAGIQLTTDPGGATAVLTQDPAALDAVTLPMARIAHTLLPIWHLDPLQIGAFSRQLLPALQAFATNVVGALGVLRQGAHGAPFGGQAETITDLMTKKGSYAAYRLLGMQMTNIGLDQRQVSGAFLVFLIDRVVAALDRRFTDPQVPQATKHKLLDDFGPALLDLDEVLRNPQLRKEELGQKRDALAKRVEDAQADAQLAEASLRLRQNLVLPREVLFAAARRHQQKQLEGAGLLGDQPTAAAPGSPRTPGRIIR